MLTFPERFWSRYAPVAAAGLVSVAATVPEQVQLAEGVMPYMEHAMGGAMPPAALLATAAVLQSAVLVLVCAALGAALAQRYGLISLLAHRSGFDRFRAGLPATLIAALLLGLMFVAFDRLVFRPLEPEFFDNAAALGGTWQARLSQLAFGAIGEEVMARWGLISLLCWLSCRFGSRQDECSTVATWYAIVLSAILYALAQLPQAAFHAPLSDLLILRTLVLYSVAGAAFGWLLRRYTLESAMLAHGGMQGVIIAAAAAGWG